MRCLVAIILLLAGCQAPLPPTPSAPPLATGMIAADAVVAAFREHRVVAIGEYHGSSAEHEFLRHLLGDERLSGVIDDVAVEFGGARHQRTIDRFVRGETVADAELEQVWTDTTQQSGVWDDPVYRRFFEEARNLNLTREPEGRIRVLLGDPPIDWRAITATIDCDDADPSCLDYWILRRDQHFASVVQSSVDRGRRVLVIAGAGHVLRNPDTPEARSLVDLLDAANPGEVWTLVPAQPGAQATLGAYLDPSGEGIPRVVPLDTGPLAGLLADPLFRSGTVTCDPAPCPSEAPSTVTLGDAADALLVL
ncbi:MAG TPA: hypothetical protein VF114_10530 [Candidatus Limnocylindria bacterium]